MKIKINRNRLAIVASLFPTDTYVQENVLTIWSRYETDILRSVKLHGKRYTLEKYKLSYTFLRNLILKLPTDPIPFTKVDRDGIPKTLWPLRSLMFKDRNTVRACLTIARHYEIIHLPVSYDTSSITSPFRGNTEYEAFEVEFKDFLGRMKSKYPWYIGKFIPRRNFDHVFTTLSRGPNGSAVACAHLDAKAVCASPELYHNLVTFNDLLGQSWITGWMQIQNSSIDTENTYYTGRLGFASEPAGKTRIFAIGDYWSQASLKVVQDNLYHVLKSLSTDTTADQDKGFKDLIKESHGKDTFCFDLSSASDRIPVKLQEHRLDLMAGKQIGEAWRKVMTERDFYIKAEKRSVRWAVGQPLGLLSSFPSFALWHHDIVQFCANRKRLMQNKDPIFFKEYKILGDDIVIFNKDVAVEYHRTVSEIIGIEINKSKSVIGDHIHSQIEFAKRLALDGVEMSSIKANIANKNNIGSMLDLIDILIERDFISTDTMCYLSFPFLKGRENDFNFLLWLRLGLTPSFTGGNVTRPVNRDEFNNLLNEKRSTMMMEKTALLDSILCGAKPLNEYYSTASVPYNTRALGLEGQHPADPRVLHPLVWAINQTGIDLSNALEVIWSGELVFPPIKEGLLARQVEGQTKIYPIEYLPLVSTESYFSTPRKSGNEYLSRTVIDLYHELCKAHSTDTPVS